LSVHRGEQDRPVLFIYGRAIQQLGLAKWKIALETIGKKMPTPPLLIADDFSVGAIKLFDGAHQYSPAANLNDALQKGQSSKKWADRTMIWWARTPREYGKISCATIIPGYDDHKIRKPGLVVDRRDGDLYDALWREAVEANPDWVLITSFNEWHEGTEIEP